MTSTTPISRSAQPGRSAISGAGNLTNTWSSMPRQRAAPSPLVRVLGVHADTEDFTEKHLDRLRRHVAMATPRMPVPEMDDAYFSPSWTAFQAERGRDFSVIVDGISN